MNSTFRLGRVAGIEIGLHWSWLLVFALIVWSLSEGVFPQTNPGLSDGAYFTLACIAAVLFFASILLHELGHAIQAQRDGVAIDGITLWVFGGIARLRGGFPSAQAELRIAAAGPAVSLVLGAAFVLLAIVAPLPAGVDGVAFWVGQMNLYLLVFNLIPALPLDGGRILRALLWARRGDFTWATRISSALGRRFGQLGIAGGLAMAIFVGDVGGIWLAFIGWFLLAAAEQELADATARDALAGLTVADAAVHRPVSVDAGTSVEQFINHVFIPTRHTAYPVTAAGRPVGIVSFRQALALPRGSWPLTSVGEVMASSPEAWIDADAPLSEGFTRLNDSELRRLLVHNGAGPAGLLSLTDVARLLEVRSQMALQPRDAHGARSRPPGVRAPSTLPRSL